MKQCPVIQDLLPLYMDDALSPESRAMVDEHLPGCHDCRQALAALRAPGAAVLPPDAAAPSDDARFLTRLKRLVGTAAGVALVLLVVTSLVANRYGAWKADREYGKLMEAKVQGEKAALAAMREASPDPLARLQQSGVTLTHSASRQGNTVRVDYELKAGGPADVVYPYMGGGFAPSPRLIDPATGNAFGRVTQSGNGLMPGKPLTGNIIFDSVTTLPAGAQIQFPTLLVYLKPAQELRWEIQRPFEEGDVAIGQRFTVAGVEFEVERIRFTKNAAQIDYRQVTPAAQVGLHLLSFQLSDRMGGTWGAEAPLKGLPDPVRPSQYFEFVASLSKNWVIQVQHAVLVLPGPTVPLEVK